MSEPTPENPISPFVASGQSHGSASNGEISTGPGSRLCPLPKRVAKRKSPRKNASAPSTGDHFPQSSDHAAEQRVLAVASPTPEESIASLGSIDAACTSEANRLKASSKSLGDEGAVPKSLPALLA